MPGPSASALAEVFDGSALGLRRGVVQIAPASDAWARTFEGVRAVLTTSAPASVVAIEHIGSTSVPGLDAKPILDIGLAVVPGTELATLDSWLVGLGMLLRGGGDGERADRMFGYEREPGIRLMNAHVISADAPELRRYLVFRDRLRALPADRDAYGALKRRLATQHPEDRLAYIAAKESFIQARNS
ncbi:MAG: GrpB family protein [Microbacterium sp.]|jgi:GrpB-like predicted nucleotidyltransferase (UPF0157 family)|nr:GrpB family protein [Microbacterium sp.]